MTLPELQKSLRSLLLSMAGSILLLTAGMLTLENLTPGATIQQILYPLMRLFFFISMGLTIGIVVESTGWTRHLAWFAGPVFRFAHLGTRCSAAFSTAIFSGVAANAMLNDFYNAGKISRHQLFLSNWINQFPAYFLHLPTTVFIVLPLTRWAGGLYFALTFTALVLRTTLCIIWGHFYLPSPCQAAHQKSDTVPTSTPPKAASVWQKLQRRLPRRLAKVTTYMVPIYIAVFLIHSAGGFDLVRNHMAHWSVKTFLPMESLSIIILSFVAEFTSGFAAAGALLDAGILTVKQTAAALLIGNILAFPMRALRHQLPHYLGIFTPKMGLQILLSGQLLRVTSLVTVGLSYYWLF